MPPYLGVGDPWRYATMAADGTTAKSTLQQPVALSDGFHCGDLSTSEGLANPSIKAVQDQALAAIHGWLHGFRPSKR